VAYLTNDLITLLKFLLPGFVTAQIFYRLTPFPKKSEFEAIVVALIFTIIIQVLVNGLQALMLWIGTFFSIGPWTAEVDLAWSIVLAVGLGLFFAYFMNNDKIHGLLRRWRITHQTSYPSEWFGTFVENPTYIVLHLKDQRRLYGWPREWPGSPKDGHFVIEDAEWLLDAPDSSGKTSIPLAGDKYILIDVASVEFVELMKKEESI
jgi:hypothetical protein